ncbi:isocitrate lyase/PEP mutase family protein [Pararhodobacter sp. SW119]|uniref:isocitrate lyase/PEP mutase family protein n=1 Tax=Pararhodobacter sp. SW119 TaxID=2780075 RepID=UPI001AE0A21E|nr:isocitrate lyase/PEP mutase family protein [Pararhodobacter sp. SW119]
MRKAQRLRQLIEAPEILVMPGAFDPLSAKLIEQAGFAAAQGTGLGIAASHLGMPDVSVLSMSEMAERTRIIARAVDIPVMADGDTGFGNAVNVWFTVRAFEEAGAAGINIEDQVMPKRCGHLAGKEVIPMAEMQAKIAAACAARRDPDFVINARTDALAVEGLEATIARARGYFDAGATMVFVDGADDRTAIARLASEIGGPLAVNMVEGGRTPVDLTFAELELMGVARVSLPVSLLLGAIRGMQNALAFIGREGATRADSEVFAGFDETHTLVGMDDVRDLERRFLSQEALRQKYGDTVAEGVS